MIGKFNANRSYRVHTIIIMCLGRWLLMVETFVFVIRLQNYIENLDLDLSANISVIGFQIVDIINICIFCKGYINFHFINVHYSDVKH